MILNFDNKRITCSQLGTSRRADRLNSNYPYPKGLGCRRVHPGSFSILPVIVRSFAHKKSEEGQRKYHRILGKDSVNKAGWKLCHIEGIGLNSSLPLEDREIKGLEKAFFNFLSPSNYFLLPKKWGGLGETHDFLQGFLNARKQSSETPPISGQADGKEKIFRDTAVENLTDFFHRFRQLNVRSNEQLDSLVEDAQKVIRGIEPQTLRNNSGVRQHVATELARVQSVLDGLLVDRPRRNILRRSK